MPHTAATASARYDSFQLIPALGSTDKLEASLHRVKEFLLPPLTTREIENWETEFDKKLVTEEQGKLSNLLNTIHELERILLDINAGRTKYQKG